MDSGAEKLSDFELSKFDDTIVDFLKKNGPASLYNAIKNNKSLTVQEILSSNEYRHDIKQRRESKTGDSFLHMAVRANNIEIAKTLVSGCGAEVDAQNEAGKTPLHIAVQSGNVNMVRFLWTVKAKPDIKDKRLETALHIATRNSHDAIVDLLLSKLKANVSMKNRDGETPLILAVRSGSIHTVRELLSHKHSDAEVKTWRTKTGDTLVHVAARRKNTEMAKLLVQLGASYEEQNSDGSTPLHIAAHEGDEPFVQYLHSLKANPNILDKLHQTPLHIAAQRGHAIILDVLVDKFKADIFSRTKKGDTLLHITCLAGHVEASISILKRGVLPRMPNKVWWKATLVPEVLTPSTDITMTGSYDKKRAGKDLWAREQGILCIHNAAQKGFVSILKALLDRGVSIDIKDKRNYTPLHVAALYKKPLAAQLLIGYGADVDIKGGLEEETALHMAAKLQGSDKIVEMLIKSGANVEAAKQNGERAIHLASKCGNLTIVQQLLEENAYVARRCKGGETALHFACANGHFEIVRKLVKRLFKGKSRAYGSLILNIQNDKGESVLHVLAGRVKSTQMNEHDFKIANTLLENGGDLSLVTYQKQETALHYGARSGNDEVVKVFLSSRSFPLHIVNKRSENGTSPLAMASFHGNLDVVQTLLRFHARVDVFDETCSTALHQAVSRGHARVARDLLDHKIYVNGRTKLGMTPLHIAAENGFPDCIRVLIVHYNATVDSCDMDKKTPLHLASIHGKAEAIRLLLEFRADPIATDNRNLIPVHYAAKNNHADVVELFYNLARETMTQVTPNGLNAIQLAAVEGGIHVVRKLVQLDFGNCSQDKSVLCKPLMLAAQMGHKDMVEFLMEMGASASQENADGMSVLHLASKFGQMKVIDMLWGKVSFEQPSSQTGRTAIHEGAMFGQLDVVQDFLLRIPASGSFVTEDGFTPLHLAAQNGDVSVVRVLMNHQGVRLDAVTSLGLSSLHMAAIEGHIEVASSLVNKMSMLLHLKDNLGHAPLHMAAKNGHKELCAMLIGQGADFNIQAVDGNTALHLASSAGYLDIVKLLIEYGAKALIDNKDGKFPICLAAGSRHMDVLDYLLFEQFDHTRLLADSKFLFDLMACARLNGQKSLKDFVLNSPVPVTSATFLTRHYRAESTKHKEYSKDLMLASEECQAMGQDLLAVACTETSERVLNCMSEDNTPLMDFLVKCETKQCVSHTLVQRYLTHVWFGEMHWAQWQLVLLFLISLLCPPIWVYLSLPFNNRFRHVPMLKFICRLISHVYLILLLCLTAVVPWRYSVSDLTPHWFELCLLLWIAGMLLAEITTTQERSGFGWIPVIVVALGLFAVWLHLIALAFEGDKRIQIVFVKNQCLGVALMLCIMQFLQFLSIHHMFGPWGIIIRHLMADVVRFLTIVALFVISFALQLYAVYKPLYEDEHLYELRSVRPSFTSLIESLFFGLFGLTARSDLQPQEKAPHGADQMAITIFAVFIVLCVIILINLLIAMMSDTYQRIQERSDIEWKFGRAKLIRKMELEPPNPVPINIFSKLVHIYRILCRARCRCCHRGIIAAICNDESEHLSESHNRRDSIRGMHEPSNDSSIDLQIESVVDWRLVVQKFRDVRGEPQEKRSIAFQALVATNRAPSRLSTAPDQHHRGFSTLQKLGETTAIKLDVITKLNT